MKAKKEEKRLTKAQVEELNRLFFGINKENVNKAFKGTKNIKRDKK